MTKLLASFEIEGKKYNYYDLKSVGKSQLDKIPFSHKILLENALRNSDTEGSNADDVDAILNWDPQSGAAREISFNPSRVLLQDFTGVPAVCVMRCLLWAGIQKKSILYAQQNWL